MILKVVTNILQYKNFISEILLSKYFFFSTLVKYSLDTKITLHFFFSDIFEDKKHLLNRLIK